MELRQLGKTDLLISSIGLGCVTFGREIDRSTSFAILDHAREKGINLLDTAAAYHGGESEKILGEWMSERSCRSDMVVTTKVTRPLTREHILRSAEESLDRLRIDSIDLFLLHTWDQSVPVDESLEALDTLKRSGQVRFVGCSNWTAEQLRLGGEIIDCVQPPYNLVQREIESNLLPFCEAKQIGVVSYSPLAAGFLTGKYQQQAGVPSGTRFDVIPGHQDIYFNEQGWQILEALDELAATSGHSKIELALAWVLAQDRVTSVLAGARDTGHIDQIFAAENLNIHEYFVSFPGSVS